MFNVFNALNVEVHARDFAAQSQPAAAVITWIATREQPAADPPVLSRDVAPSCQTVPSEVVSAADTGLNLAMTTEFKLEERLTCRSRPRLAVAELCNAYVHQLNINVQSSLACRKLLSEMRGAINSNSIVVNYLFKRRNAHSMQVQHASVACNGSM